MAILNFNERGLNIKDDKIQIDLQKLQFIF